MSKHKQRRTDTVVVRGRDYDDYVLCAPGDCGDLIMAMTNAVMKAEFERGEHFPFRTMLPALADMVAFAITKEGYADAATMYDVARDMPMLIEKALQDRLGWYFAGHDEEAGT